MHRSSESIGAMAAVLAKSQSELINPERSLVGVIGPSSPALGRAFRYAPLSSGLIVRKSLRRHAIAIVHSTDLGAARQPEARKPIGSNGQSEPRERVAEDHSNGSRGRSRLSRTPKTLLEPHASAALRDQLMEELAVIAAAEEAVGGHSGVCRPRTH
jgi:hypothetical protein